MTTQWTPDGPLDTPYARARAEWDARMGGALVHARNWRLAACISLSAVVLSTGGMIVEVDRLGAATYHGPVGQSDYVPPDTVIVYHLRRFLEDTREISSDLAVLKRNWLDAYTLLTPRGANMLSAFVQKPENDPFRRAQDERVTVEILSAVRAAGDTWQVDWRESAWDKNGAPLGAPAVWRAMLRTLVQAPKTAEAIKRNPIGLYIDELHWDKVGE
jgi:type IV secretory pathway TrbF-like protein